MCGLADATVCFLAVGQQVPLKPLLETCKTEQNQFCYLIH